MTLDKLFGYRWLIWLALAFIVSVSGFAAYQHWKSSLVQQGFDAAVDTVEQQTQTQIKKESENATKLNQHIDSLPGDGLIDRLQLPETEPADRDGAGKNGLETRNPTDAVPEQQNIPGYKSNGELGAAGELPAEAMVGRPAPDGVPLMRSCIAPPELFDGCYPVGLELLQEGCPQVRLWECKNNYWVEVK